MKLLHSVFLLLIPGLLVITFSQPEPAKFRGVIVDADDARILKVFVHVENGKNEWHLQANEYGEFSLELPAGIYKFTLDPPFGFKKLIVSDFQINDGATINYEFKMEVGNCSDCDLIIEEPTPAPSPDN